MSTKKILVTGAAGFIGSHLCEELVNAGHTVVGMDNLSTGAETNLPTHPQFSFFRGDVNTTDLQQLFAVHNFDWVFHYAAVVGVKRTLENPAAVLRDLEGIRQLLELCRKKSVGKVLFASSSEVYGEPLELPEREEGPINAKLPYAVVKLAGEKYLEAYHREFGLRTVALRLFNVYGPRQTSTAYGFVAGIFLQQALAGKPLTLFGDGTQSRDFVYIRDNIAAAVQSMERKQTDGTVINVGSGTATTIKRLAEEVLSVTGSTSKLLFLAPRPFDIQQRYADVTKFRKLIGYEFQYSLHQGLQETLEWMHRAQ
ncbi:MAG TPA: NAD-dependent epimerase/dehydratase family protein [Candidatus Nanoarchaeia archaeon]|nr:NAD-dependent epimerase/dehydratase family protein [Candidatus Nanoarchaeia archaeon]